MSRGGGGGQLTDRSPTGCEANRVEIMLVREEGMNVKMEAIMFMREPWLWTDTSTAKVKEVRYCM